ncbi:S1 family peptidase [Rhizobium sp. LEGMi135b]
MKKLVSLFLNYFFAFSSIACSTYAASLTEIVSRDRFSVAYITGDYFDDKTNTVQHGSTGTGFIVSGNGYIITATHVIKDWLNQSDDNRKKFPLFGKIGSKNSSEKIELQVIAADLISDISLLRFADNTKTYQPAPLCFDGDPKLVSGSPIYALGFPNDSDLSPVQGSFSNDNNPNGYLEASIAFSPGLSGGPVYNSDGKVVGIVEGGIAFSSTTNFIIPLRWARSILSDRTTATSKCVAGPTTENSSEFKLPNKNAFCARMKDIIQKSNNKFAKMRKETPADGFTKVTLPAAKWCSLNAMPVFGSDVPSYYYSCMMSSNEPDEPKAMARFDAYRVAISECLGSEWTGGEVDLSEKEKRIDQTFTSNAGGLSVRVATDKDEKGSDLMIYISPQ